jgi:hypothetical protein
VPEGLRERLHAGTAARFPSRPSRERLSRQLVFRVAGAVATVVGVAAIAAVLFLAAPTGDTPASSEATGVEYTFRLVSYDGSTPPDPPGELARVLEANPIARAVPGLTVSVEGDAVRMFVPGTHDLSWADRLLNGTDLAVYDQQSVIAAGRSLGPVLDAVAAAGGPPTAWYVVVPKAGDPDGGYPPLVLGPFGDQAQAEAEVARQEGGNIGGHPRLVAVGGGIHLVVNWIDAPGASSARPYLAALRDPLIHPGEIDAVRGERRTVTLVITPPARAAVSSRLQDRHEGLRLVSAQSAGGWNFSGWDASSGEMTFRLTDPSEAAALPGTGGVEGTVVASAVATGPALDRGPAAPDSAADPFLDFLQPTFHPRSGTVRLTIDQGAWKVWTWLGRDGDEVFGATKDGAVQMSSACSQRPEAPWFAPCVSGQGKSLGRLNPRVAALSARYAQGPPVAGIVRHGWFILELPADRGAPVAIDALDDAGSLLGQAARSDLNLVSR